MAEIDSLSISIKTSTHEAIASIDKLIATLGKLNQSLNLSGIDVFVNSIEGIATALNSINTENVERLSASMRGLASAGKKLSTVGDPFGNVTGSLRELSTIQLSDTLSNLNFIKDSIGKIGGDSGQRAGAAMRDIASGLQSLNVPIPPIGQEILVLANGLRALGSGNIVTASQTLPYLAEGLRELNAAGTGITADAESIMTLANAVKQFGYAKVEKSIANLPVLTTELRKMIDTLAQAPEVSQNTIELVKAIGNLNVNTRQLAQNSNRAGKSLELFAHRAKKAHSATFSLAATIGKIYATYWALFRVMGMFKSSINLASDLKEIQNVVDHTFGDMKYRMEDFAKSAVETVGMSELTAKKIASQFQAMGHNMGIPEAEIKKTNVFLQESTKLADGSGKAYANVADSMADISINLTKLTGDMASFYNMDYEEVAEKMNAVFTGQTRPLRSFGLDLTQASLKAFALANGLNADIKNMTQAEKTLLRYQYVMANTTAAHGDFERTIGTWANQIKLAKENLKRLQIVLGQIGVNTFKPLVANFNSAMNDIIHLAQSTFNSLGKIFGWQIEMSDVGILDDMADGLEDIEDGYEDAGKEAKKFKNFLLGIDELNLLPDNDDKNKGSGDGDALGALANGYKDSIVDLKETERMFDSIYDTLFKLGKRIGEVQKEWLSNISWEDVFEKAEKFGKGLASFLNGYLSDSELFYQKGRFIANGINTLAHAIYGFFHEFDGYQLGKDLGFELNGFTRNLDWDIINDAAYEMAHDVTETINGFFENVNWKDVGKTIAEGLNVAIRFVSTLWNEIHWDILGQSIGDSINGFFENIDAEELGRLFHGKMRAILDLANNLLSSTDFELIGEKIGKFLSEIHIEDFADDIAMLLWNVFKAAINLLPGLVEEAPLETALILAFTGFKFAGFGNTVAGGMAGSISTAFAPKLTSILTQDLFALSIDSGLMGAAEVVGLGLGTAIVAAAATYVGYNLGLEIGKKLNPDDEMWYTKDAWIQAILGIKDWGNAIDEGIKTARTHLEDGEKVLRSFDGLWQTDAKFELGVTDETTWEELKNSLRVGTKSFTDDQYDYIKQGITESGASPAEINSLINQLKDAQNEYETGFKNWLESNENAWYAVNYGHQSRMDFYQQYLADAEQQEKGFDEYLRSNNRIAMAIEKGSMTIEEARRKYDEMQSRGAVSVSVRKPMEEAAKDVTDFNGVMDLAASNMDRATYSMGNSVERFALKQADAFEYATRTIADYEEDLDVVFEYTIPKELSNAPNKFKELGKSVGNFGKQSADAMANAILEVMKFGSLFGEESSTIRRQGETMFDFANKSSGSGIFTGEARAIENLNTKLLTTKTGIENISLAMENMGNKKDKTTVLKDSFDGVKGKVDEIANLFSADKMANMFSGIPDALKIAWQNAINVMKVMWTQLANWVNGNAKIEVPKVKVGSQEIGGQTVQLKIPRFDVGGSIPNNGSLFVANENGAEVVANMGARTGIMNTDQMKEAVKQGMAEALAASGQNVNVYLNGDAASFFTAMVKENNSSIMRTGTSPLRV